MQRNHELPSQPYPVAPAYRNVTDTSRPSSQRSNRGSDLTARYQRLEPFHGVRERWVGPHSRVTAWGSALVVFGALVLEVQQPDIGIKLGNLIFMLACARAIALRCLLPPRTAAEVSSPSEYDLLIAFSLLWGAYSIVHSSSPQEFVRPYRFRRGALDYDPLRQVRAARSDPEADLLVRRGRRFGGPHLRATAGRVGLPACFLKRGARTARLLRAPAEVGNADRDRSRDRVHRLLQQGTEELDGQMPADTVRRSRRCRPGRVLRIACPLAHGSARRHPRLLRIVRAPSHGEACDAGGGRCRNRRLLVPRG